jgi:plasmid maintenance system antidote protein VapI
MVTPEDEVSPEGAVAPEDGDQQPDRAQAQPDTEAFIDWLRSVPDPVQRYSLATSSLEKYQEAVQELSLLRGEALADASTGESLSAVARRLGMSRQRVHQLVSDSKVRTARTAGNAGRRFGADDAATKQKKRKQEPGSAKAQKGRQDSGKEQERRTDERQGEE